MPESKKVVIKLDIHDPNDQKKALKAVSGLSGIESLSIDKDKKLTIVGDIDPVDVVGKLKKWHAKIDTVGPAKEPEKKKEEKKPDDKGKEEEEKAKKEKQEREEAFRRWMEYCGYGANYNPYPMQQYCLHPVEEDPTGCVIC